MRFIGRSALAVFAFVCLAPARARADQVDIAADRDNSLYEESGSLSNGAGDFLFTGRTDQPKLRRALLHFDIAKAVPPGATITSATLTLWCSRTKTMNQNVALHRVLGSWGEGTSNALHEEGEGASATTGDATWTHRFFNTTAWTKPGGDFVTGASATTVVAGQNASYTWSSGGMTADVQGWLDAPSTNHGWIVVGNESGQKVAKRFNSRSHPDLAKRPRLRIVFTLPVATKTGACCATDGSCTVVVNPGTACSGAYRGADTTCSPNLCPQPTGACCVAGACSVVTQSACLAASGGFQGAGVACATNTCMPVIAPFVDALPRPAVATPATGTAGGTATYQMSIVELDQKLHTALPATRVWGFSDGTGAGGYPGPTIEASEDQPIRVTWRNNLRDKTGALRTNHILPVETCLTGTHGAKPRTVIHLHGGHVPMASDGYPEWTQLPGEQTTYDYPNHQEPATLWYHDHAIGITRLNVYMGLAGFYLVRSPAEKALGLPSGEYEIPLAIQDRSFTTTGAFSYPSVWADHFEGDYILVNGKIWPYLDVKRGKYRFRILNGANARTLALALSDGSSFQQIGTDGGLLPRPVTLTSLSLGAGERADVVVDFSARVAGQSVVLRTGTIDVMKFRVVDAIGHTAALPTTLRTLTRIPESAAVVTRDFHLDKSSSTCGGVMWEINGLPWETITEKPTLGTTEIWRFVNDSGASHPMHMHLVQFQILDRTPFGGVATPPAQNEAGFKDTVDVRPNETVRVIARFEDYAGKFAYHCHVLEHEDNMMMRQFETVVADAGVPDTGAPDSASDTYDALDSAVDDVIVTDTAAEDTSVGPDDTATPDDTALPFDSALADAAEDATEDPTAAATEDGGCGCRTTGSTRASSAGLALGLVAAAGLLRRRSRR